MHVPDLSWFELGAVFDQLTLYKLVPAGHPNARPIDSPRNLQWWTVGTSQGHSSIWTSWYWQDHGCQGNVDSPRRLFVVDE